MEAIGVIGFVCGLGALSMVIQLKATVEGLKNDIEKIKNKT